MPAVKSGGMESEMIYTVTFNPSLDYVVRVGGFRADTVNRTLEEHIYPGGKGNNVAVIASGVRVGEGRVVPARAMVDTDLPPAE